MNPTTTPTTAERIAEKISCDLGFWKHNREAFINPTARLISTELERERQQVRQYLGEALATVQNYVEEGGFEVHHPLAMAGRRLEKCIVMLERKV